jgi:hypothetical protein
MATVRATGLRLGDAPDETRVSATGRYYGGPKQLVIRVEMRPKIPSISANWEDEPQCDCYECSDDESYDGDSDREYETDYDEGEDDTDEEYEEIKPKSKKVVCLNAKTGKTLEVTQVISARGY